ncbi:AAA family ATPase [Plantactinospora sp. CA-294935]|uniref:AAA family ATPase n=1 Tax=Plantactinospora sp. CA-294935 TaxID=3240012 RepID=UPI003D91EF28
MSNYAESRRDLDSYIAARVPLIGVRTIEQVRAIRLVKDVAANPKRSQLPFWIYTRATGIRDLRNNSSAQEDRSLVGAMDFAAAQFTSRANATVVLVDPDDLGDDNAAARHVAELARLADANSGSIIVVTDTPLWSGLQRLGMSVTLDLPDATEMYEVIVDFLGDHHGVVPIAWTESDARRAAEFLVGVPEGTAVNVLATIVTKGSVDREDVERLAEFKDKHFGDLAGLERVHLKEADHQVGGLTSLRSWLRRRHQIMVADLRGTELRPPRGVLLVGVPGCGKSLSAKAVAAQWRLPLYRMDLAAILGQYVGQSEGRLREALDTADRVAPCVLWIDEIEKGLAGQNDSTGVGRRMVGQFLFWLQESRSRVFLVATSNDIRSLPPELLRKGRFDELFFVDLPDAEDRGDIVRLYYRRYVRQEPPPELVDKLVALSDGFAGSDIEAALHEVGAEVLLNGGTETLRPEFVLDTFANTYPLSRTNPEQIEEIRAWGRERAIPAGRSIGAPSTDGGYPKRRVLVVDEP